MSIVFFFLTRGQETADHYGAVLVSCRSEKGAAGNTLLSLLGTCEVQTMFDVQIGKIKYHLFPFSNFTFVYCVLLCGHLWK